MNVVKRIFLAVLLVGPAGMATAQSWPAKGSPPALRDVMGGQVGMTFDVFTTALPLARSGERRALAVATAKRSNVAPGVLTLAE